jgi:antitoxin MazE
MKAQLIRVGNSRGVRIPKALLDQTGISDEVDIGVQGDAVVVRRAHPPREGWDAAFAAMAGAGDDVLVDAPVPPSSWDEEEWEW